MRRVIDRYNEGVHAEEAARVLTEDPHLASALTAWAAGDHYEAHEALEEVAEAVEDHDPTYDAVIALVHVAACLHKLAHRVGARAVPGKLDRALETLRATDPDLGGLAIARLVSDLESMRARLDSVAAGAEPPSDLRYPILVRAQPDAAGA